MTELLTVTDVCAIDELEPFWGEAALVDGHQVALFLFPDGSLYATSNQDPATGSFVMSRGIVGSRGTHHTIASPLHKEVYNLDTGECFTNPSLHLPTFEVSVVGGRVLVATEPQVTGAYVTNV